jgi:Rps23 Pro-64 3,4-dihydroxylase Tpa1-like proline 4-hydroxylase
MEYEFYTEPVTFCIIKNFYSKDEVDDIHEELANLKTHFLKGEVTGAARNLIGKSKKDNHGIFLDDFYKDRKESLILQLNRKVGSPHVIHELSKGHWFFKYLSRTQHDTTLVSYYQQGDYYKTHEDQSFITAIYYTWKEPKSFEGGDIYFGNFKVPIENNSVLIFPSNTEHRVSEVTFGVGRYAISQFISYEKPHDDHRLPIDRFLNFLPVTDFNRTASFVFDSKNWNLSGKSQDYTPKFWYLDLSSEPFFNEYLLQKIRTLCQKDFQLKRVYANGQTFGQDGAFHQDDTEPNCFTFIMYLNPIDECDLEKWGGETQFKVDEGFLSYVPLTNSAILFDSRLWHRGMSPNRHVDVMRVTVAWKLYL